MDLIRMTAACAAMAAHNKLLCISCSEMLLLDWIPERDALNMYSHAFMKEHLIPSLSKEPRMHGYRDCIPYK